MTVRIWNRMLGIVGVTVVTSLGLSLAASAQPPPDRGHQDQESRKEAKRHEQAQKKESKANDDRARNDRQHEQELARQLRQAKDTQEQEQAAQAKRWQQAAGARRTNQQDRGRAQDRQDAIRQQEQRLTEYRDHMDQQQRRAQAESAALRQQNRLAQFSVQQEYLSRLRLQQSRVEASGRGGYYGDADSRATYRYSRDGRSYETNQRGADLLRQAVNYGYQEGCRAGLADRQDHWRSGFEGSYAYEDANYGYPGYYVDRDAYNAYFREGFRRGYEDGYQSRYRYGRFTNGRVTILGAALSAILSFEAIR